MWTPEHSPGSLTLREPMCQGKGLNAGWRPLCETLNELARQYQQDFMLVSHHRHMETAAKLACPRASRRWLECCYLLPQ